MRRLLVVLAIALFTIGGVQAQEYKLEGNKLVKVETKTAKKGSVKTALTVEIKGVEYPVYRGAKGGHYIIRTSKKSGKEYKQYLKIKK